jgi:hypothetical protein
MTGNKILLTGAGFSHNFKLPLARHVWTMIFNDPKIQKSPSIRCALFDRTYNYESLYEKILSSNNKECPIREQEIFLEKNR